MGGRHRNGIILWRNCGVFSTTNKGLVTKGKRRKYGLRFDFWIEHQRLLIEYDGRQHYDSIPYFGGDEGLERTKERDELKNAWAADNGMQLLRISYLEDDAINSILADEVKH